MPQLFHDLFFGMGARDRKLFDQQITRGVEHLSLAERKLLVAFENEQIAQHFGDFKDRTGLDFLGVFAITPVPGLLVGFDLFLAQALYRLC